MLAVARGCNMNCSLGTYKLCLATLFSLLMLRNADLTNAKDERKETCGLLNEKVLHNNKVETAPTEFPWTGLLLLEKGNNTYTTDCLGSLISKQHILLPAHCIYDNGGPDNPRIFTVQMRLWIKTTEKIRSCNNLGYCTKTPKWYTLIDIKVHPYYDKFTKDNNIAIGTLNRTVKFSNYLQPICLDPISPPTSFVGKYFFMSGFTTYDDIKKKTGALVVSPRYYNNHYVNFYTYVTRTQLCAHQELNEYLIGGTPLMGINVDRNMMKSFYLVGHLDGASKTERPSTPIVSFFTNIQLFVPWIKQNMIFVRKNATAEVDKRSNKTKLEV